MIAFSFVMGTAIWGALMLQDSVERQEANNIEYMKYLQDEPIRQQLMNDAEKLGYTNSDLIMNMTGLCWYNFDNDSLFGQCDGQRERIDLINSQPHQNYTWSIQPNDITWHLEGLQSTASEMKK